VTIANLLAFPIGSFFLPQDMWLQYILSFFVLFAAFMVAFVIPETRNAKQHTEGSVHATQHSHQVSCKHFQNYCVNPLQTWQAWATDLFIQTKDNLISFSRNHNLIVCLGIICLNAFARPGLALFARFGNLFLHLPDKIISQLELTRIGVTLAISITLALVTPHLKAKFSPNSALFDVWTTRVCFVLLAVGTVMVGISTDLGDMRAGKSVQKLYEFLRLCNAVNRYLTTVSIGYIVASLGSPVYQAMQGIIVSFVGPANFGILYSGIAAAELIMEVAGSSIFVATFDGATDENNRRLLGIPIAMSGVRYSSPTAFLSDRLTLIVGIFRWNGTDSRFRCSSYPPRGR
jgi:hypothetical protein